MKKYAFLFILVVSFIFVVSCSTNQMKDVSSTSDILMETTTSATPTPTPAPNPSEVIIANGDLNYGLIWGDYFVLNNKHQDVVELTYNYLPKDVNIAVEEWTSSNEDVATVNDRGVITPVGLGSCEITLHISDGLTSGTTTSITVTVEDGMGKFEGMAPSFEDVYGYVESNIQPYADSFWPDYQDSNNGFTCLCNDEVIWCYNSKSEIYSDADVEKWLNGWNNGANDPFYICQFDNMTIVLHADRLDALNDEYHLAVDYKDNDDSVIRRMLDDLGFPDFFAYYDLEALK